MKIENLILPGIILLFALKDIFLGDNPAYEAGKWAFNIILLLLVVGIYLWVRKRLKKER